MNVYVPPIIEKVYNIQGSTAAPGSGEYHRYRALRRRERTLAAVMEKEFKEKEEQRMFEEERMLKRMHVEERTRKKKLRRDKKKMNKKNKKKSLMKDVIDNVNEIEDNNNNIITTNINNSHNEHEFVPNTNVCKIITTMNVVIVVMKSYFNKYFHKSQKTTLTLQHTKNTKTTLQK